MKNKRAKIFIILAVALVIAVMPGIASAHELRVVGNYNFVVGFLNEPAYAGQQNGLDLTICDGVCKYVVKDGSRVLENPVLDAEKSLKAEVSMGSNAPLVLTIATRYGMPGKYAAYFLPSTVGAYTYHIYGELSGSKIDEKFTSGPKTFGEAQLLNAYPASVDADMMAIHTQIKDAKDSASTATYFGIAGIAFGVIALGVALTIILRKPKVVVKETEPEKVSSLKG